MNKTFIINDLYKLKKLLRFGPKYRFSIQFSQLTQLENQTWQNRIEKHYDACGCEIGSAFVFAGIVISLIFALLNLSLLVASPWQLAGYFLGFLFIMGGIGKIIGLIYAHIKLKHEIMELTNTLNQKVNAQTANA